MKPLKLFSLCSPIFLFHLFALAAIPPHSLEAARAVNPVKQEVEDLLNGNLSVDEVSTSAVWDIIQGGDIIGNGTGIIEVRFFQSFYALPSLVNRCLDSTYCPLSKADKEVLLSVSEVLKVNLQQKHQLLFLSGKAYPRFFVDSDQIGPRTAKTGFRKGLPIFLNRDHFYKNGSPNIQIKEAIAILIHELGHQTGERSHTKLDALGTRFASWATGKSYFLQRKIENDYAEFSVMNPETPNRWPLAWISWKSESQSITAKLKENAQCKDRTREPVGASLSNLHWRREFLSPELTRISASAWVTLYCLGEDTLIYEEDHSIDLDFTIVFQPERKEFVDLRWNSENLQDSLKLP